MELVSTDRDKTFNVYRCWRCGTLRAIEDVDVEADGGRMHCRACENQGLERVSLGDTE